MMWTNQFPILSIVIFTFTYFDIKLLQFAYGGGYNMFASKRILIISFTRKNEKKVWADYLLYNPDFDEILTTLKKGAFLCWL